MTLSGIVVMCPPERTHALAATLAELPGVEVHYQDEDQGKIIVVQEAPSIAAEIDGLGRIKALPGVILADMLYHYFEEDPEILEGFRARQSRSVGEPDIVPTSLSS